MNIRIALASLLTGILLTTVAPSADAGIAIAIAYHKNSEHGRDVDYWIRYNSTSDGYQMEREARQDFKKAYESKNGIWFSAPSTRSSKKLQRGHYLVIRYDEVKDGVRKTTFALGYGTTANEAQADAIEELGRRNWSWNKTKGYTVDRTGTF